jgi:hypothetical protein
MTAALTESIPHIKHNEIARFVIRAVMNISRDLWNAYEIKFNSRDIEKTCPKYNDSCPKIHRPKSSVKPKVSDSRRFADNKL